MEFDDLFEGGLSDFRAAFKAEEEGKYQKAHRLFTDLWLSGKWSEDKDLLLHYANVCEKTGDYKKAMQLYTQLMQITTINPSDTTTPVIKAGMSRLNELIFEGSMEIETTEINIEGVTEQNEADLISELFNDAMDLPLPQGSRICAAGDIAHDMWMLMNGSVDVFIDGEKTATLSATPFKPCLIGEVAYFTGTRRTATLVCATDVKLLELSFTDIDAKKEKDIRTQKLLDYMFRSRLGFHLLSEHDIFKKLGDADRRTLALSMRHMDYEPGELLVEQGQTKDIVYMMQSGTAMMMKKGYDGNFELVSGLHPGDIFHLGGLLKGFKSPCRIITGTSCRILRMSARSFEAMVSKYPSLIKDILVFSREESGQQIVHPEKGNLWAGNRYIDMDN